MDLVETLKILLAIIRQGKRNNSCCTFVDKISDHNYYRMLKVRDRETSLHICVCFDGKHLKYFPENTSLDCALY